MEGSDDYAMMREVLTRHYGRVARDGDRPADLVMVDGGPGQLAVARAVLDACGFATTEAVGLAKREEIVHRDGGRDPVALPGHSPARLLLQRVRDEAHRFAITYHRVLRDRRTVVSALDGIPATLAAVRGISAQDAERIVAWFAARRDG